MSKAVAVTALVKRQFSDLKEEVVFFYVRDNTDKTDNVVMQSGGNTYVFDVRSIIEIAQLAEPGLTTPQQLPTLPSTGEIEKVLLSQAITPDDTFMVTEAPLAVENEPVFKRIVLPPGQLKRKPATLDRSPAKANKAWTTKEEKEFIAEVKGFGHYIDEPGGKRLLFEALAPKFGRSFLAMRARFWKLRIAGTI